jgi:hypothetical protein
MTNAICLILGHLWHRDRDYGSYDDVGGPTTVYKCKRCGKEQSV